MNRREFAKISCQCALAVGVASIIPGCKTTSQVLKVTENTRGEIIVPIQVLKEQAGSNLLVEHPVERFPISIVEYAPDQYSACLMSCTHFQCETAYTETQYVCPCHGARFTHMGEVMKGPATDDLRTYSVEVEGDEIRIVIA